VSEFEFELINYKDVCQIVERIKQINITASLNLKLEPHLIRWANFHCPDETILPTSQQSGRKVRKPRMSG